MTTCSNNQPARNTEATDPPRRKGDLPAYEEAFDDRLLGALKSLDEKLRACLLLRTVEEMSEALFRAEPSRSNMRIH